MKPAFLLLLVCFAAFVVAHEAVPFPKLFFDNKYKTSARDDYGTKVVDESTESAKLLDELHVPYTLSKYGTPIADTTDINKALYRSQFYCDEGACCDLKTKMIMSRGTPCNDESKTCHYATCNGINSTCNFYPVPDNTTCLHDTGHCYNGDCIVSQCDPGCCDAHYRPVKKGTTCSLNGTCKNGRCIENKKKNDDDKKDKNTCKKGKKGKKGKNCNNLDLLAQRAKYMNAARKAAKEASKKADAALKAARTVANLDQKHKEEVKNEFSQFVNKIKTNTQDRPQKVQQQIDNLLDRLKLKLNL